MSMWLVDLVAKNFACYYPMQPWMLPWRVRKKYVAHLAAGVNADFPVVLNITSSFGVSVLPSEARTPSELVEFADLALYEAKTAGTKPGRKLARRGTEASQETTDSTEKAVTQQPAATE